jgi:periplasmic protein CpxP/Spy
MPMPFRRQRTGAGARLRSRRAAPNASAFVMILTLAVPVAGLSSDAGAGTRAAGAILVQATPPGPAAGTPGTAPPPAARRGPIALVEARITQLHKELGITAAEEPQFKAYAEVMRSNAQTMQSLFEERAQSPDRTAIGELRWYAKLTQAHAEAVGKLVPVFEALYQSMSDKQKRVADAVFAQLRQRPAPRRAG